MSSNWQERLKAHDSTLRIHLLGIGGAGLSAIARVLLEMGVQVSGSDRQVGPVTGQLAAVGARIFQGQAADNLLALAPAERPHVVLMSSAVGPDNPERQAAISLGIPVVRRNEFLPALLAGRQVIAVAGTHGKSTTTAMIVKVLRDAGIEAGYIVGAHLPGYGNASAGRSPYFVIEADEYDRMFLGLRPTVAVITNVEWDHPDCYPTPTNFQEAFSQFVDTVHPEGLVVSCRDDPGAEQIRARHQRSAPRWITYGLHARADLRAVRPTPTPGQGYTADLQWWHAPTGPLTLGVPGLHNVRNALAALAVSCWCNVPSAQALESLRTYRGTARRFEIKGEAQGVLVVDDYAHHPTEIQATLAAARARYPERQIRAVFQPHTFSRTRHMLYRMGESFQAADEVIVTDIYAAREQDDGSVTAGELVGASPHPNIRHISRLEDVAAYLAQVVAPGDLVITLGAGDSYRVGELLLERLQAAATPTMEAS